MTILIPCSRALPKKVLPRSAQWLTRLYTTSGTLSRVQRAHDTQSSSPRPKSSTGHCFTLLEKARAYATTTTSRSAGRPKAHTGRTAAAKKPKTAANKGKKKPGPKPKKKAKPKPKGRRKLSAKATERKAAQQRATELKELRTKALLDDVPKKLPQTAWQICFVDHAPKKGDTGGSVGTSARQASQAFRNMSSSEREQLERTASNNKLKNETAYSNWVQSLSPLQIKEANHARDQLQRKAKAKGRKTRYSHIRDDRLVTHPANAYALYVKERYSSGDLRGMKVGEAGKLIGREWKGLSASEKKPYEDQQKADQARYIEEYQSVYGSQPPSMKKKASA